MSFYLTPVGVQAYNGQTCSICTEDYEAGENVVSTKCNHLFHETCIREWEATKKTTCPYCRCEGAITYGDRIKSRTSELLQGQHIISNIVGIVTDTLLKGLSYLREPLMHSLTVASNLSREEGDEPTVEEQTSTLREAYFG